MSRDVALTVLGIFMIITGLIAFYRWFGRYVDRK